MRSVDSFPPYSVNFPTKSNPLPFVANGAALKSIFTKRPKPQLRSFHFYFLLFISEQQINAALVPFFHRIFDTRASISF